MQLRLGYLVPEFPSQTHTFFWREILILRSLGVELSLISTRKPPRAAMPHAWAAAAMATVEFLFPARLDKAPALLWTLARTSPAGFARCFGSIARAEGLGVRGRIRLLALILMGAQLVTLARKHRLSHVHVHSCADAAHVALFAHLLSGLTYSLTLHGPLSDYGPNQREKWRHASLGIVITRRLYDEVRSELQGSLPPALEIAPMGVNTELFRRRTRYRAWGKDGALRVFSCGRLNPCKGHDRLIDAIAILRSRGLDATLEIAGEDEAGGTAYRRTLEALVADKHLSASVALLGAVDEERVLDCLEAAHLFVLASISEPLGVAIMEAMAMEVPVVATNAGGVPELIEHEEDGILVPPGDSTVLADAIERLARAPDAALRLSGASRAKIEAQFRSDRSANLLVEHLRAGRRT